MKRKRLTVMLLLLSLSLFGCVGPLVQTDTPIVRSMGAFNAPGQYGVEFYADVTGGQEPVLYRWEIDGGALYGQEVIYHYNTNGDYAVTVTATDAIGRTATESIDLKVYPNEVVCYWNAAGAGTTFPDGCWECTFEGWGVQLPQEGE